MDRGNATSGNFVLGLIWFILIAGTAVVLLITSLVVWLSVLTGSMIGALLIVSGICFIAAGTIYLLALREKLSRIQDQIDTIYEVAHTARSAYKWIADKFSLLVNLRDILFRDRE